VGQKIHPIGLRLGINRTWDSLWYSDKHYVEWLHQDLRIRDFINKRLKSAGVSQIVIRRPGIDRITLSIRTSKPGIIIGKRGAGIEELRKELEVLTKKPVKINIEEISHPEVDAKLVAESIAEALERRVSFRRAMKQAAGRAMKSGAKGIKIQCGGRLAGAEIARSERTFEGKVPLHTLRAEIDYSTAEAGTTYGRIGIKVWIYKGDIMPIRGRGRASANTVVGGRE
jgi:small subunit ribosomal protein S3